MANIVGDIAIQVGADISPLVRDLSKAKREVSSFGADVAKGGISMSTLAKGAGIAAAGVAAVAGAMVAFTRTAMDNIDALSKQARAAGVSVASFQAMSQVAEEAGVSSEQLSKTFVKMQDNISNLGKGTALQVESFKALGLSYESLKGKGADEQFALVAEAIDSITDPTEKTAAAIDIFGKSGADAINMLGGFRAAVANAAEYQRQFGLAVSDTDAANIEAANDAIGRVSTAIGGLGTQLAVSFAPGIEAVAVGLTNLIADVTGVETALDRVFGSGELAKAILGDDVYNQLTRDSEAFNRVATEVGSLAGSMQVAQRVAGDAATSFSDLSQELAMLSAGDISKEFYDIAANVRQANSDFADGRISIDQYQAILATARDRATELLVEAGNIDGVTLDAVRGQVAALGKVLDIARGKAVAFRAALGSTSGATAGANASASATIQIGNAPRSSPRPREAPTNVDFGAPDTKSGGGGGGGGGSKDKSAEELKRIQDQFATKAELEQSQYAAQLAKLEEFRNSKLLKEGEFNDLEAKMKAEHEQKLADIEKARRNERLDAFSGAFGDLATLMQSGNQKLFKIGQLAAISQASVSGYQAAVDAWQKGMKVGGPPTAALFAGASLLKTGAMIAKIASQSANGGGSSGGSGGGSGSTPTAAAAPQQPNIANVTWHGEATVSGFRSLTEKLNAEFKQGYVLNIN